MLEIEKKKVKPIKKEYTGPMIRYHSVRMPLIEEVPVVEPPTPIPGDMRLDDIQVMHRAVVGVDVSQCDVDR